MKNKNAADFYLPSIRKVSCSPPLGVRLSWTGTISDLGPAQLEHSRPRHAVIPNTCAFLGHVIDHKYLDVVILSEWIPG